MTHDRHIILTYLMSKSWISHADPILPRAIFVFLLLLPHVLSHYQINQNLTQLLNFSGFF